MIDSEFHFEINGVKYRAAEDAEGDHYVSDTPTLRAPNTQVVQGSSPSKVNINPDVLMWSWTDWSGGEAQLVFDPSSPARSQFIQNANFFGRPGNLLLGYDPKITKDNGGGSNFSGDVTLVVAREELYALAIGSGADEYYSWVGTSDDWSTFSSVGSTDGARDYLAVCGDGNYLFFVKHNSDELWRWDGSSWANHNDQTGGNVNCQLAELGNYVYKYDKDGKVYELSKTTANTSSAETPILDFSADGDVINFGSRKIVAADNRIYVMANYAWKTVIYEIVPSTAAQVGFGRELTRFDGMRGESIWAHGGWLFWTGVDNEADGTVGTRRVVYYLQPGASFGALGEVRSYIQSQPLPAGKIMTGAGRLNTWAFVTPAIYEDEDADSVTMNLFEVDAISGGFGAVGSAAGVWPGGDEHYEPQQMVFFEGKIFVKAVDKALGTTNRVMFWDTGAYHSGGGAYSPAHDFGVAATKVLHSIEIECDPLSSADGHSITISYRLDGGSWTALSAYNTNGGTGEKVVISTDGTPKTFRSIEVRATLASTDSTTSPILKAVHVRASVNETFKAWQLLVDCTDETSPRGHTGATLISNLDSLDNDSVIDFKDGYPDRTPGVYTSNDVVVERVTFNLDKPGEGVASVLLREVT